MDFRVSCTDLTLSLGVQQQRTKWISRKSLQSTSPALGHRRAGKVTDFSSLKRSSEFFTFLGKPLVHSGEKQQKCSYFRTRKMSSRNKVFFWCRFSAVIRGSRKTGLEELKVVCSLPWHTWVIGSLVRFFGWFCLFWLHNTFLNLLWKILYSSVLAFHVFFW